MMAYIKGFIELIRGMMITGKHLGMHAITIQYPEQRDVMPERSRGVVVLLSDKEDGSLNCTACELCMKVCPSAAIKIVAPRGEDKKKKLEVFEIDFGFCCYCGLCEEACNFSALKLTGKYEFSSGNKDDVLWDVHKLQEAGRDVDYIDTRKKKVKKVAPKPTEAKPTEAAETKPAETKVETEKKDSVQPPVQNDPTVEKPKTEGEA